MRHTTRFNPTTNGPLHIGHAYTALVNQHEAHSSGGRFILRFDDNTRYWVQKLGGQAEMAKIAHGQQEDLEWLGIVPDTVAYQSKMEPEIMRFLAASKWQPVIDHQPMPGPLADPRVISDPPIAAGGLWAFLVAEKVVGDHMMGTNLLIRGLELLSEDCLYKYFAALFGYPLIETVYIPRLMTGGSADLADVSKTAGNWKIRDVRERGRSPAKVRNILALACLIDEAGPWSLDNLKARPVLNKYLAESL